MNHVSHFYHGANKLKDGFKLFSGNRAPVKTSLKHMGNSFKRFQNHWDHLSPDHYLRDGGCYRLRRYSVFQYATHKNGKKQLITLPHEAHFQGRTYNNLHGGIKRDYKDWTKDSQNNQSFRKMIQWAIEQITPSPHTEWRIQAHQFRITATPQEKGKPTPEGIHKDGADFILIMLLKRHNVKGGVSRIFTNDRELIQETQLTDPGDTIILDDKAVWHGVTQIEPEDPDLAAFRDVLVLTFHRM